VVLASLLTREGVWCYLVSRDQREVREMVIRIAQLMDGATIVFGAATGLICFKRLVDAMKDEPEAPEVLFVDFGGIEAATVSFLREGPLAFRKYLRDRRSNFYPVFANLVEPVFDSLSDFLRTKKDALFCCKLEKGRAVDAKLVGELEDKQCIAFDEVTRRGEATAVSLAQTAPPGEPTNATAWNNRLAALVDKGLLIESKAGRSKTFRVTLSGAASAWA
jgi:hypothetical protein